jgi:hypothetical protein
MERTINPRVLRPNHGLLVCSTTNISVAFDAHKETYSSGSSQLTSKMSGFSFFKCWRNFLRFWNVPSGPAPHDLPITTMPCEEFLVIPSSFRAHKLTIEFLFLSARNNLIIEISAPPPVIELETIITFLLNGMFIFNRLDSGEASWRYYYFLANRNLDVLIEERSNDEELKHS